MPSKLGGSVRPPCEHHQAASRGTGGTGRGMGGLSAEGAQASRGRLSERGSGMGRQV